MQLFIIYMQLYHKRKLINMTLIIFYKISFSEHNYSFEENYDLHHDNNLRMIIKKITKIYQMEN